MPSRQLRSSVARHRSASVAVAAGGENPSAAGAVRAPTAAAGCSFGAICDRLPDIEDADRRRHGRFRRGPVIVAAPAVRRLPRRAAGWLAHRLQEVVGGRARALVVVVLACVLALESADLATIGAAAPQIRRALAISNTELGLLAAVSTLVGAIVTVPAGALAD